MNRTRRFLSGVTLGFSGQVLITLVGLWLTPFLLRRITDHGYGLWVVATQIMTYLMLMDLGVVALLPRETAYETGRAGGLANAERLPTMVGETIRIVLWQWPVVAAVSLGVLVLLPSDWADLRQPLAIILGAFVFFFPFRVLHGVLEGLQDLAYIGRIFILSWGLNISVAVLLVLAGWGLYALAAGWIAGQVVSALAWLARFPSHFPSVLPRRLPRLGWNTAKQQLGKGMWVSASQVAHTLLGGTEVLIIGKFFGPAAVVPYVCTSKLVSVLANQPAMLMRTAMPALSELRHAESREKLHRVAIALGLAMLAVSGAVFAVVLAINEGFVKWWVGPQQYGGFLLTLMLCVAMIVRHLNVSVGYAIFSFGHERHLAITAIQDGVGTVAAAALLVWWIGPVGAPIASIAGAVLIGLRRNVPPLARDTSASVAALVSPMLPWVWRFLVVIAAVLVASRVWQPEGFLELTATGAVVGCFYLLVVWPAVIGSPLGDYIRPRLVTLRDRLPRPLRARSSDR
jgi:O-antigen/teichoic acid export membrane protein